MTRHTFPFHKYSGCGNDFILIDHRIPFFRISDVKRLCDRRRGIGADGLILLESSVRADFRMRIFNADGSEAEMCGNGIRCLLPFLHRLGVPGTSFRIETMQRLLRIAQDDSAVAVDMGPPTDPRWDMTIPLGDGSVITGHYLDTGVPHLVIFVDSVDTVDVEAVGRELRYHALFSPRGVNVNFISRCAAGFAIRTYERGVEGETLACGTGATAAALAIAKTTGAASPVTLRTRSDEELRVGFCCDGDHFHDITLSGHAEDVYRGEFFLFKDAAMGYDDASMTVK